MNDHYFQYTHKYVSLIEILVWNLPFGAIYFASRLDQIDKALIFSSICQITFYILTKTCKQFRLAIIKNPIDEKKLKAATTIPLVIVSIIFVTILLVNMLGKGFGEPFSK